MPTLSAVTNQPLEAFMQVEYSFAFRHWRRQQKTIANIDKFDRTIVICSVLAICTINLHEFVCPIFQQQPHASV